MIKAALVGMGWWGKYIIKSLHESDKLKIEHVVDIQPDAVRDYVEQYGVTLGADYDAALSDPNIDAVILATPNSLHESQVLAGAAAGKHVFCEKPLGLNRESAVRSVETCAKAGVKLGVGHERRFEPALMEIKRMIDGGELGTVLHVESNFSHDKLADVPDGDWRTSSVDSPVAGMTAMGIHLSDAYLNMLGPITEVFAQTVHLVGAAPTGDLVSVQVGFESGASGYFSSVLATPLFLRYQVFGADAWAEARNETHPDTEGVTHLTVYRTGVDPVTTTYEWVDTVRENLHAFADSITGEGDYPFTAAQNIANISVLEAVCASAKSGTVEKVA